MATRIALLALLCVSFLYVSSAQFPYVPGKKVSDSSAEWAPGHWKTCMKSPAQGVAVCTAIKHLVHDDIHFWREEFISHSASKRFELPSLCTMKSERRSVLARLDSMLAARARDHKRGSSYASYDANEEDEHETRSPNCGGEFAEYKMCNEDTVHMFEDAIDHLDDIEKTFKPLLQADVPLFTEDPQCKHICTAITERMMFLIERSSPRDFQDMDLPKYRKEVQKLNCETVAASAETVWLEKDLPDGGSQFYNVLTGVEQPYLPTEQARLVTVQRFPAKSLKRSVCKAIGDQWILSVRTRIGSDPTPDSFFKEVCQSETIERKLGKGIARGNSGWFDRCVTVASTVGSYYTENHKQFETLVTKAVESNEFAELTKEIHRWCDAEFVRSNIHAPLVDRSSRKSRHQCPKTYGEICEKLKSQFMSMESMHSQFAAAKKANPFSCLRFQPSKPSVCLVDCEEVSAAMSSIIQPLDEDESIESFSTGSYLDSVRSLPCGEVEQHFEPRLWEPTEELSESNQLKAFYVNRATNKRSDEDVTSRFSHCSMSPEAICRQLGVFFQQYAYEKEQDIGSCDTDKVKDNLAPVALKDLTCQRRCRLLNRRYKWAEDLEERVRVMKRVGVYINALSEYAKVLETTTAEKIKIDKRLISLSRKADRKKQDKLIAAEFKKIQLIQNDPILRSVLGEDRVILEQDNVEVVLGKMRKATNIRQDQGKEFQRTRCTLTADGVYEKRELPPSPPTTPIIGRRSLPVVEATSMDLSTMEPPVLEPVVFKPLTPLQPPADLYTPPMLLSQRHTPRHIETPTTTRVDDVGLIPRSETPKAFEEEETEKRQPSELSTSSESNESYEEEEEEEAERLSTGSPVSSVETLEEEEEDMQKSPESSREFSRESVSDSSVELPPRSESESLSLESTRRFSRSGSSGEMSIESPVDSGMISSPRPPPLKITPEIMDEEVEPVDEPISSSSRGSRLDSSLAPTIPSSSRGFDAQQLQQTRGKLRKTDSTPPPVQRKLQPPTTPNAVQSILARRAAIDPEDEEEEEDEEEGWD